MAKILLISADGLTGIVDFQLESVLPQFLNFPVLLRNRESSSKEEPPLAAYVEDRNYELVTETPGHVIDGVYAEIKSFEDQ